MIQIGDGQTASWVVTTAPKPIYQVQVMVVLDTGSGGGETFNFGTFDTPSGPELDYGTFNAPSGRPLDFDALTGSGDDLSGSLIALWVASRSGSSVHIEPAGGGEVGNDGSLLIERFDPPVAGDVHVNVHVLDLLRGHPGDGVKNVTVLVTYDDGTRGAYSQLILVDTSPSTAYAFYARSGEFGGYLRYYDAPLGSVRARVTWPDGSAVERPLPEAAQGALWLPATSTHATAGAPVAAYLIDASGNESHNILAGTRSGTPEVPETQLIPWALPPYIEPQGWGFGAIFRAVERALNLGPDAAGVAVDPRTTFGSHLEVLASVFGLARRPDERDDQLRARVYAALRQGKATPEGLTAILTSIYNVPVQIIDHNIDPEVPVGTFLVYLFAVPSLGLDGATQIVRNYRAAGLPPTLTLTLRSDPAVISPRWVGAHAHLLHSTSLIAYAAHAYYIDGTWYLDNTVSLGAWSMTRWSHSLSEGVLPDEEYGLTDGAPLTLTDGTPYTTTG